MSRTNIANMIATASGDTSWFTDITGAWTTLLEALDRQYDVPQVVLTTMTGDGAVNIDWSQGADFKIDSDGYDITSLTESNAPASDHIRAGTLYVVNNGATATTVDTTGLSHGLTSTFDIPAGTAQLLEFWSVG